MHFYTVKNVIYRICEALGSHDDLFWAVCVGVYGIKKEMNERSPFVFASNNLNGEPTSVAKRQYYYPCWQIRC